MLFYLKLGSIYKKEYEKRGMEICSSNFIINSLIYSKLKKIFLCIKLLVYNMGYIQRGDE